MVEENTVLDHTLAALADPTRRALLKQLGQGAQPVTRLAAPHDMSLNAVSKHIKILERAGLVRRQRQGRTHMIIADPAPMRAAADWFETQRQFWATRLDRLEALLMEENLENGGENE